MIDQSNQTVMTPTRRLYYEDVARTHFEAEVVGRKAVDGFPAVALSETCFYPESGGQPWDLGRLNGVEVFRVLEEDDVIWHVTREDIAESRVRGSVDWARRFDHMQQHTGQHILSQSFFEILKGVTLSFHLGEGISTVEIGVQRISEESLDRVELRANAIVFEDREIKTYFVPEEKIKDVPLRKPPKKEGLIRVVEVAGFDYSACGGTHCRRTGEIGLIKVIKTDKIRNNIRFEFVCGGRALGDYAGKTRGVRSIAGLLSVHEKDAASSVEKSQSELKNLKKRARKLEERLALFEAREVIRKAEGMIIRGVLEDRSPEEAKLIALNVIKQGRFIVLYGLKGEEGSRIILAGAESLGFDMRRAVPAVTSVIAAKGGGSPTLVELVSPETERLAEALEAASHFVRENLPAV